MTLDTFHAITEERIPTADEFAAFVRGMGWAIRVEDSKAFLRAPKSDPVAVAVARMLKREPWRTNVLKQIGVNEGPPQGEQRPKEKPPPQLQPCTMCQLQPTDTMTETDLALTCDRIVSCPMKSKLTGSTFSVMQNLVSVPNCFSNSSGVSASSAKDSGNDGKRTTKPSARKSGQTSTGANQTNESLNGGSQ